LLNATGRFGKGKELSLLVGCRQVAAAACSRGKDALWGKGRDNEWSGTDASFWRKHMENREDEVNGQIANKFVCT
jgi:hypothetical protein